MTTCRPLGKVVARPREQEWFRYAAAKRREKGTS